MNSADKRMLEFAGIKITEEPRDNTKGFHLVALTPDGYRFRCIDVQQRGVMWIDYASNGQDYDMYLGIIELRNLV